MKRPSGQALRLIANAADVRTQKIRIAARAADVEVELVAPAKGAGAAPELWKGEQVVRYTNAILRFFGRVKESSDVYGSSFFESAEVDSWLEWGEFELGGDSAPHLAQAVEVLERHLDGRVYLVGQRFTLADASIGCSLDSLERRGVAPRPLPRATQRWLRTCQAHDAFRAVLGDAPVAAASAAPAVPVGGKAAASGGAPTGGDSQCLYSRCVGGRTRVVDAISGAEALIGQKVSVCGWVKTKREGQKGQVVFVELNDGSCVSNLQVVIDAGVAGFDGLKNAGTGASLNCTGEMVRSQGGKQGVELGVRAQADHEVVVFGTVDAKEYPLSKKSHGLEFLREIAHLRPRSNFIGAVARVRSALAVATHEFFRSEGFLYVHTPLITAADCEGAGEMFQVTTLLQEVEKTGDVPRVGKQVDYSKDFFGKKAFLTVSGQLSVENYCCALSNVYTFGPTFRAENSHTSRHLSEFWMIEPELAFADINDDMDCAEDYLKHCVRYVMENNREDLEFFDAQIEKGLITRLENLLREPFARVTYTEAVEILIKESPKAGFKVPVEWGMDLNSEHERYLTEKVKLKPTIVYNYPKAIKAFYMRGNEDGITCAAMDVLAPAVGEVIGGSQREERLDVLDARLAELDLDPKDYWWYRDLRKYGSVPHSGFGLGFERLIMLCTGVENIRDVIPYPRYPGHAEF